MSEGKIRVLHMGLDDRRGGIESFLFNMAGNVDWGRFQFDFLCYGDNPAFGDELRSMGAELIRLPSRKNVAAYWRFLKKTLPGYDVVHLHKNSPGDFLPVLAARGTGAKVVVHAHNTAANLDVPGWLLACGRAVINGRADQRLSCSGVAAEWLYGDDADKALVVSNGINLNTYGFNSPLRGEFRREHALNEKFVVGCIGRFTKQKNQTFLVSVLRKLIELDDRYVLVFLGDGELRGAVSDAFDRAGLGEQTIFMGSVDDVPLWLQAFDAVVMPSLYEGLPLTAIESQAAGLPLIVSDTVTEEIDVTPLVKRLSLETDPAERWARAIAESIDTRNGVNVTDGLLKYDARNAAQALENVYFSVI